MKLFYISSQQRIIISKRKKNAYFWNAVFGNFLYFFRKFIWGESMNPDTSKLELFVTLVNGFQLWAVN